jgi:hypothetical protein
VRIFRYVLFFFTFYPLRFILQLVLALSVAELQNVIQQILTARENLLGHRSVQSIPVYAKFLGGSALIPSLIFEHGQDESLLELPHRFRASHTGFIHLQDKTL